MSYQANLDIVLALERLQISSFKKQGTIRLKIKVFGKQKHDPSDKSSKVTVPLLRNSRLSAYATLTTSTKPSQPLCPCISPLTQE